MVEGQRGEPGRGGNRAWCGEGRGGKGRDRVERTSRNTQAHNVEVLGKLQILT